MNNNRRNKLLQDSVCEIVSILNRTEFKLPGGVMYIDPELTYNQIKYCSTRPYMSIPFWVDDNNGGLKYTLVTNVISDSITICINDVNDNPVAVLWTDKLNIHIADINLGRLLYIVNSIYWDMKLGSHTTGERLIEIHAVTDALHVLWTGVQAGTKREEYSKSLLDGLSKKYDEMLARTELTSDAFKQQKE